MKKRRTFKPNPKTPLDNWSTDIDPAIMSGDHWAEEENAPIEQFGLIDDSECEEISTKKEHPYHMFMHPTINVSYGNFVRETKK